MLTPRAANLPARSSREIVGCAFFRISRILLPTTFLVGMDAVFFNQWVDFTH